MEYEYTIRELSSDDLASIEKFDNNIALDPTIQAVDAEEGEDFQEYAYFQTRKRVPAGTRVGYEVLEGETWQLYLLKDIIFYGG